MAKRGKAEAKSKRRPPSHESKGFLCITEGQKTEPNYLNGLLKYFHIPNKILKVQSCGLGSSPKNLLVEAKSQEADYNIIYLIFDKDRHAHFESVINEARQYKKKITTIVSVPCFEIWLLLHFVYTTKPYAAEGDRSPGTCVIQGLKEFWPDYEKGITNYRVLFDKTQVAIDHAKKLRAHCQDTGSDCPMTQMDLLIEELLKHSMRRT